MNIVHRLICRLRERLAPELGFRIHQPGGLVARVDSAEEWVIYDDVFQGGEYDRAIDLMIEAADGRPSTVLDLGANVGYFGLRAFDRWIARKGNRQFPFKIAGCEGVEAIHAELVDRMRDNGLSAFCNYRHGLAGARSGTRKISTGRHWARNRLLGVQLRGFFEPTATVPFVDLEELADPARPISLLKCDIEGAELLFLQSYPGLLKRTELLVIEFHPDWCDVAECRRILAAAGFQRVDDGSPPRAGVSGIVELFRRAV